MLLSVDDFGCVPDGRYLSHVSIQVGSAQLSAPGGGLRQADIGKHIAIPGAVDLVATISGLLARKDVASASMEAGGRTLTAVLTAADGFFQARVHEGLRITVAGAGPQGATLVSDVSKVTSGTTLELADAAATTVTATHAILNRRDVVALSDYARATAVDVTVDLVDRVVTDVRMTVGQRGMRSQTAAFSSLDLGKTVTIRGAGRLVTTIQAVTSSTLVTVAAPAHRVVTDGPADVWRTDSRPGFQQLLAALEGLEVESADIRFGPGVYDFTRIPQAPGAPAAALGLEGLTNLRLLGAGPGVTIIRLMPDQDLHGPDTHVILARHCKKLTVRDLTVNGAYLTMDAVNEQMHGFFISEGCQDVVLERVEVFQSAGDGVRLLGAAGNKVRRVWLDGCRLVQNKRSGVSFQREAEFVWVRDCYVEMTPPSTDACIDFEPTGSTAPTDVVVDSNVLIHGTPTAAVSLSGIAGTDPARRIRFTGNTVLGGAIGGVHAQDVTVAGNTIIAGGPGSVMLFRGLFDGLRVEDNRLLAADGENDGIRLAPLDGFGASSLRISGNEIQAGGIGISLLDVGSHVEVRGNRILGQGTAMGILVSLSRPPDGAPPIVDVHHDVRIVANTVTNFGVAGIQVSTANTLKRFDGLEIGANQLDGDAAGANVLVGIRIPPPGAGADRWLRSAVVSGNRIADGVGVKIQRHGPTVPFVAISGNPGDRAIFEGDGNPNQVAVVAPPGSLFLQIDDGTSAALFLKASGSGGTGWVAMAQAGP